MVPTAAFEARGGSLPSMPCPTQNINTTLGRQGRQGASIGTRQSMHCPSCSPDRMGCHTAFTSCHTYQLLAKHRRRFSGARLGEQLREYNSLRPPSQCSNIEIGRALQISFLWDGNPWSELVTSSLQFSYGSCGAMVTF